MSRNPTHLPRRARELVERRVAKGERIQVFPSGIFDSPRGVMAGKGPWKINAGSARRLIERAAARTNAIVIDYEYQTLKAAENGQPAPAAGWIQPGALEWAEGMGLFAAASWTDRAKAYISSGEYKFLGPVFDYDRDSGEVLDLLVLSLTNVPAIDGMQALGEKEAAGYVPVGVVKELRKEIGALKGNLTHGKAPEGTSVNDAEIARRARAYKEKLAAQGRIISVTAAVDAVRAGTALNAL